MGSYLKVPEHLISVSQDVWSLLPGDRIAGQDTRYNISCTVNSVRNRTAGVAGEVILELVQHVHGKSLLQVRAR